MKLVIDLQACQTPGSRHRGVGRYSLALATTMARLAGGHEVWITANRAFPETLPSIHAAFEGLLPPGRILSWHAPGPVAEMEPANGWRRLAGERLRAAFLETLRPDAVHVSSLTEGLSDEALVSIDPAASFPQGVTLYDLIPLHHPHLYLSNPRVNDWYRAKISHLRAARLWLAISEASRQEGIATLGLPENRTFNVSCAADPMFRRLDLSPDTAAEVRRRYRLEKPFLLYTGGADFRKNLDALVRAFALLPPRLRREHRLAIVCSMPPDYSRRLRDVARAAGLAEEDLVLTGYIPDADLVALYNLCSLFVFPSWHEGFGFPALEAMSCGAPVIGSNLSSVPEVIGRADALFNPHSDQAIAGKMAEVLSHPGLAGDLRAHGEERARLFSWEETARRAWAAYESTVPSPPRPPRRTRTRPRLAYVSPIPPDRSGIADYSAELLPFLSRHYDIEIVTPTAETDSPLHRSFPVIGLEAFERKADFYDRVLYQMGNSHLHTHILDLAERVPGTVVQHDFYLSGLLWYLQASGQRPGLFDRAILHSHGIAALKDRFQGDLGEVLHKYPCNLGLLEKANGVISHTHYSLDLARLWYGEQATAHWAYVPLLKTRPPLPAREEARRTLGIPEDDFVVCSFGALDSTKLNTRTVEAWLASPLSQDAACRLVFVGEGVGDYAREVEALFRARPEGARVRITGYVSREEYQAWLAAADTAVQLRVRSRGGGSAGALDAMSAGLSLILNAHGCMTELPPDTVAYLPDLFHNDDLAAALTSMRREPGRRADLGRRAAAYIAADRDPEKVAAAYHREIERFATAGPRLAARAAIRETIGLGGSPAVSELGLLADALTQNLGSSLGTSRRFVDVTALLGSPGGETALANAVRGGLNDFIPGRNLEFIYREQGGYRRAERAVARILGFPPGNSPDPAVLIGPGDTLSISTF